MTDLYLRLDYRQYKNLEQQLTNWAAIETTHTSVDGYYHKALRLEIGDITLEIQGPAVKEPIRDDVPPSSRAGGGYLVDIEKD
jgi:hypothetical protein